MPLLLKQASSACNHSRGPANFQDHSLNNFKTYFSRNIYSFLSWEILDLAASISTEESPFQFPHSASTQLSNLKLFRQTQIILWLKTIFKKWIKIEHKKKPNPWTLDSGHFDIPKGPLYMRSLTPAFSPELLTMSSLTQCSYKWFSSRELKTTALQHMKLTSSVSSAFALSLAIYFWNRKVLCINLERHSSWPHQLSDLSSTQSESIPTPHKFVVHSPGGSEP